MALKHILVDSDAPDIPFQYVSHFCHCCSEALGLTVSSTEGPRSGSFQGKASTRDTSLGDKPAVAATEPGLVTSSSTGSDDSCATTAVVHLRESAVCTGDGPRANTPAACAQGAATAAQSSPAVSGTATAPTALATAAESCAPTAQATAAASTVAAGLPRQAAAMPGSAQIEEGAALGGLNAGLVISDESLAPWVKLPQHGPKGRAAHNLPSPEQPWQVRWCHSMLRHAESC